MLLSVLAGCTDSKTSGDGPDGPVAPTPSFSDDTGALQGIVVTDAQLPIAGADVGIDLPSVPPTKTDAGGNFVLNDLPPGPYILIVEALGYLGVSKDVVVTAGQATVLDPIVLESKAARNATYKKVVGPIQGRFFCGFSTPAVAGPCKVVAYEDPEHPVEETWATLAGGYENNIFDLPEVLANKTYTTDVVNRVIMEVKWTPTSSNAQILQAAIEMPDPNGRNATYTINYAYTHGPSPLRLEVQPGVRNRTGDQALSPKASGLTLGVFPFPPGPFFEGNITTPVYVDSQNLTVDPDRKGRLLPNGIWLGSSAYFEQDFTVYLTVFFNGPPPAGYTVYK